jgi:hypothetical protein
VKPAGPTAEHESIPGVTLLDPARAIARRAVRVAEAVERRVGIGDLVAPVAVAGCADHHFIGFAIPAAALLAGNLAADLGAQVRFGRRTERQ